MPETKHEWAIEYASRGWPVFPIYEPKDGQCSCGRPSEPSDKAERHPGIEYCSSPAKHPRIKNGLSDASTNPNQINHWWAQWPNANIGMATGERSGFVVVDIDPRHGGNQSFQKLQDKHGKVTDRTIALTGGDGYHLLFKYPGHEIKNNQNGKKLGAGVDVRGDGGYIVAAPSVHISGKPYRWQIPPNGHLPVLPQWLDDLMTQETESSGVAPAIEGDIIEGNRDNALASMAGSMRRRGMAEAAILAALLVENERCVPPLSRHDVERIAKSICRYKPADVPNQVKIVIERSGVEVVADEGEWGDFIPLDVAIRPPFPLEALSPVLRDFTEAVAHTTQTPPDICGTLSLAAVAAAVHGKVILTVKPGWVEWATLYVVCAAPSGSRKSAVFKAVMQPLLQFEKNEQKRMRPIVEKNKLQKKLLEAKLKNAAYKSNSAKTEVERGEAETLMAQLHKENESIKTLELPKLFVEDVTTERLATLLSRYSERLSLFSPEGDTFKLMAGMYNSNGKANLSLYLKSYDGEFCRIDRQDQDRTISLNNPSLAIGLAVQPSVVRKLAEDPEFLDRGVIQRFLFSFPPDTLGYREVETVDIPEWVKQSYELTMTRLMAQEVPFDGEHQPSPEIIKLSPLAQEAVTEYQSKIERILQDRDVPDGLREWRSKAPGKMARIALLLTLADEAMEDSYQSPEVGLDAVARAIQLIEYYAAHTEIAFGVMSANKAFTEARMILDWLKRNPKLEFTKRECYRCLARQFNSPDALAPALKLLWQLGYTRRRQSFGKTSGNYQVNPAWVESVCAVDSRKPMEAMT